MAEYLPNSDTLYSGMPHVPSDVNAFFDATNAGEPTIHPHVKLKNMRERWKLRMNSRKVESKSSNSENLKKQVYEDPTNSTARGIYADILDEDHPDKPYHAAFQRFLAEPTEVRAKDLLAAHAQQYGKEVKNPWDIHGIAHDVTMSTLDYDDVRIPTVGQAMRDSAAAKYAENPAPKSRAIDHENAANNHTRMVSSHKIGMQILGKDPPPINAGSPENIATSLRRHKNGIVHHTAAAAIHRYAARLLRNPETKSFDEEANKYDKVTPEVKSLISRLSRDLLKEFGELA